MNYIISQYLVFEKNDQGGILPETRWSRRTRLYNEGRAEALSNWKEYDNDTRALTQLNNALQNNGQTITDNAERQKIADKTLKNASERAKEYGNQIVANTKTLSDFKKENEVEDPNKQVKPKFTDGLKSFASSALSSIGNAVVSAGTAMIAQQLISWGLQGIDAIVHWDDNIIAKGKEAKETILEQNQTYKDQKSQLEELQEQYTKYASGVKISGNIIKNATLSDEDFQAFLDTSNQIANLAPSMIDGWDSEGNAILKFGTDTKEANQQISDYIQLQRDVTHLSIRDNLQGTASGVTLAPAYADGTSELDDTIKKVSTQAKDWIETALDRLERIVEKYQDIAESDYSNYKSSEKNYDKALKNLNKQLQTQKDSRAKYVAKANEVASAVGLSDELKKKVQNGTINIESLSEDDKKRVDAYQEWYEKILDCDKAIRELTKSQKDLAKAKVERVIEAYDTVIGKRENKADYYKAKQELRISQGYNQKPGSKYEKYMKKELYYTNEQKRLTDKEIKEYKGRMKEYLKVNGHKTVDPEYQKMKKQLYSLQTEAVKLENEAAELVQALQDNREQIGNKSNDTSVSNCRFYVPSLYEIDPTATSEPYISETNAPIAYFTDDDTRKKANSSTPTEYKSYWTRSPNATVANWLYTVNEAGGTYGFSYPGQNSGILLMFSISSEG